MRKMILIAAAPLLLVTGTIALSSPARAMELGAAVKACEANPNCTVLPARGPGATMIIKSGKGVGNSGAIIDCPPKGQCTTARRQPKGGQAGARAAGASSERIPKPKCCISNTTLLFTCPCPNIAGVRRDAVVPTGGILEPSQGFGTQGPGATGTPQVGGRGAAPAGQIR
jgi:hypothetical protein